MALAFQDGRAVTVKMDIVRHFLLGYWVLQLCCFGHMTCCSVFEHPLGSVTGDQEIEVGSTLTFHCTLFNKTVEIKDITSRDIILKLQKKVLVNTRIVDKYTVEYTVHNATANDTGLYNCFVPLKEYSSPQLVCSSYIAVGYKPLDVHDFSCISVEYTNLTCSWTPPYNPVDTEYILNDFLFDNKILSRQCPVPLLNGCQFRLDTKPAYIQNQENLNFILNGNNSLGKSTQYFRLKHSEIIKPGVPNAATEDVSKTSLVLRLDAPRGLQNGEFPGGLVYSVKYYSISSKLNITKVAVIQTQSNVRLKIEDLVPHTQYRFEVRCRLNFSGDHFYWSDTYNKTDLTKPDAPYRAPVIDNSAFDIQVIGGNRTITLYWKAVPSEFENGKDFHYIVRYHEHYVPTRIARQTSRMSNLSVRVDNKTSYSFEHMDMNTAYMFNIIAANQLGNSSNNTAIIVVDKNEKILQGSKDMTVISYGQGNYDISWKAPDVNLTNFTLYWCETLKSRPAKCEGPLDWTPILNKTYHKLFLPSNFTNYQFAVATVHNHKSSGMVWAPCTVLHGVTYSIPKIELIPKNSTSLRVRWSLKCEAEKKIIKEYAIYYCPYEGKCTYENARNCKVNGSGVMDWPYKKLVNTSLTEYILGPLDPFRCYFSYIRVRTDAGWGVNSEFASEITMSSAPSGPPTNVQAVSMIQESKAASIRVSFDSPKTPNGIITRYKIFYNQTSSEGATYHKEVRLQAVHNEVTLENVLYYSNYSIEVSACVDQACSEKSEPVYVYTGISRPGTISLPRVELMDDFLNVTWESPRYPNGPADFYQVKMMNNDTNVDQLFNVSRQNFFTVNRECSSEDIINTVYDFKVRAVNFRDDVPLFGDYSGPVKMMLCPRGFMTAFNIGVITGVVLALFLGLLFIFYGAKVFFRSVNEAKKTQIKLPKGLESPLDVNPLGSYDKFKSGLHNSRDSGIPNDRAYDRLFSSASEGDLKKANELAKRGPSGRNPSGESSVSGKGQDSISSANTTKTHNSLDSGAEVESPPSPDSFSSDSVSMNTTPRIFKPDLGRVNEINQLGSKDSGLVKDDRRPINFHTSLALSSKGRCFEPGAGNEQLSPYSKFAVRGTSCFYSFSTKCSPPTLTLSNSEPSVADFDVGDGCEPLMNPGMLPYSKFGLASSAGNGLNSVQLKPGYSKFGAIYRPLKTYRKMQPQRSQVFPTMIINDHPVPCIIPLGKLKDPSAEVKKLGNGYSKFGEAEPSTEPKKYISLNLMHALTLPVPESVPSHIIEGQVLCELPGQSTEPIKDLELELEIPVEVDDSINQALPRIMPSDPVNTSMPLSCGDIETPKFQEIETSSNIPNSKDSACEIDLSQVLPSGHTPMPLSCGDIETHEFQEIKTSSNIPDSKDSACEIDLNQVLPPNFVVGGGDLLPNFVVGGGHKGGESSESKDKLSNGLGVKPKEKEKDTGVISGTFLCGGKIIQNDDKSKNDTSEQIVPITKHWFELFPITINEDLYCDETDGTVLPEQSVS